MRCLSLVDMLIWTTVDVLRGLDDSAWPNTKDVDLLTHHYLYAQHLSNLQHHHSPLARVGMR